MVNRCTIQPQNNLYNYSISKVCELKIKNFTNFYNFLLCQKLKITIQLITMEIHHYLATSAKIIRIYSSLYKDDGRICYAKFARTTPANSWQFCVEAIAKEKCLYASKRVLQWILGGKLWKLLSISKIYIIIYVSMHLFVSIWCTVGV